MMVAHRAERKVFVFVYKSNSISSVVVCITITYSILDFSFNICIISLRNNEK